MFKPSHHTGAIRFEICTAYQLAAPATSDINCTCQEMQGNGLVTLEELTRLASPLGVRSANVAKLFTAA